MRILVDFSNYSLDFSLLQTSRTFEQHFYLKWSNDFKIDKMISGKCLDINIDIVNKQAYLDWLPNKHYGFHRPFGVFLFFISLSSVDSIIGTFNWWQLSSAWKSAACTIRFKLCQLKIVQNTVLKMTAL